MFPHADLSSVFVIVVYWQTEMCSHMLWAGEDGSADASNVSVCSDEGLDVSQQFAETVFTGSSLNSDAEEIVSGV